MTISSRHILEQSSALGALGRVFLTTFEQQVLGKMPKTKPPTPGPLLEAVYPARSKELVTDYIRHVGGDPAAYKGTLPAHMFPQWGFGLAGRALDGVPYRMARVLNGGCNYELRAPIPAGEPLQVTARLESIDDDGRRAVMQQRVTTSTPSVKDALICDMFAIVPLGGGKKEGNGGAKKDAKKDVPSVPKDVREVAFLDIHATAGLDFAKLTGDFNPIHWIPAAAKASGFPNVILHGFGTMARTIEALNKNVFGGNPQAIKKWSCRFTKPLVLPAKVSVYVKDQECFIGAAPGGPAYLVGSFES